MATVFRTLLAGIVFLLLPLSVKAQAVLSELLSDGYIAVDELSPEEFQILLDYYVENPLIWNLCTVSDIEELPLNYVIKALLFDLKKSEKKYSNWSLFQEDIGLSDDEMEAIRLFIRLKQPMLGVGSFYNYLCLRRDGDKEVDLSKNLLRGRWSYASGLRLGIVAEADQGERSIWDFCNVTFQLPQIANGLDVIGGAFRIHWGHGLLFTTNLMGSRGSDAIRNLIPRKTRIGDYLGADENRYFFGSTLRYSSEKWSFFSFFSNHRLDATIKDNVVTSLRIDGLHETASQMVAKDALLQRAVGFGTIVNLKRIELGGLFFNAGHSYPIKNLDYRKRLSGFSLFHRVGVDNFIWTGEYAYLFPGLWGAVQNGIFSFESVRIGVGWRYLSPDFHPLMGYTVKKYSGDPSNEKGIYAALEIKLKKGLWISSYADFYSKVQSVVIGEPVPKGTEISTSIRSRVGNKSNVDFKYKRTVEWGNSEFGTVLRRSYFRGKWSFPITEKSLGVLRICHVRLNEESRKETGTALGLSFKIPIGISAFADFGTIHYFSDSFQSRLYIYEPSIPGRFGMVILSGTGYRFYGVLRKRIGERFEVSSAGRLQYKHGVTEGGWKRSSTFEFKMAIIL